MHELSILRVTGLVGGTLLFLSSFLYLRGKRWSRSLFVLVACLALYVILVSAYPNTVNWLRTLLNLEGFAYGRLLALTICASVAGILLAIYAKARADQVQHLLDRVICADAAERMLASPAAAASIKPIMILMPALNEEHNLQRLLPRIPREIGGKQVGILVVDDGSSDATGAVAASCGCMVARNSIRRGQGAALRVGYVILQRCGADIVVTMDADNQHSPEDLDAMLAPLLSGEADFVLGSRRLGSAHTSDGVRSAGVVALSHLISILSGQRITDCSSGFKAFRMRPFSQLDLREDQFQNSEVLMEATKKGLRIVEVPIRITERAHGTSHKGSNMFYGFHFTKAMVKTWWR